MGPLIIGALRPSGLWTIHLPTAGGTLIHGRPARRTRPSIAPAHSASSAHPNRPHPCAPRRHFLSLGMLAALRHRTNEWLIQRALTLMSPRRKRLEGMKGDEVFCPCCTGAFVAFLPFGVAGRRRAHALCPQCGSLERHRLMWLFIQQRTSMLKRKEKVLHVAPERFFFDRFSKDPNIDYTAGDKFDPGYSYPAGTIDLDITRIQFPDRSFDTVICSHVLEHVPDDALAMRELLRVLKPGGHAIIQVPLKDGLERTDEDITITDPKERERRFGQHDHVRYYGLDVKDRLAAAGFEVEVVPFAEQYPPAEQFRMGLVTGGGAIYFCRRPA